eukprot:CAMPEP_0198321672 /NCGR_PEP_ID=MMETSP1450-20131203/10337_1 /TAXON_ID=753684 ORGANISM="Madagascaria erythrocladiodes, Strain CCMP3234" /NCGR_SAMPLE_ID=MMETSP1450 /ASSEMBLY_ACC=CAM_ASM_001115 /LENGTH=56 /DNA_ID=CAMNT_0044025249 /DNA_START=42 /DNA_END=208 /DNA_ORIENTATION=-
MTISSSKMKRHHPPFVTMLDIGTVLHQYLQAVSVAHVCSTLKRRDAVTIASGVRIG